MGVSSHAAVMHGAEVLALGSCSQLSFQLHHLPVLKIFVTWRSCALLQPTLKSLEQVSGKNLFIVG